MLFFHHLESLCSSGSSAPSGTTKLSCGQVSGGFALASGILPFPVWCSLQKCFLLELEYPLKQVSVPLSLIRVVLQPGAERRRWGPAEGPWQVQGWTSSWKYPSGHCISFPTLLALLLLSLLQIPSPLVSWREQVMVELEAHPYKLKCLQCLQHAAGGVTCICHRNLPSGPQMDGGQVWQTWTGRV